MIDVAFDPRAHAVAQTVAALRLEGWAPTDDDVARGVMDAAFTRSTDQSRTKDVASA